MAGRGLALVTHGLVPRLAVQGSTALVLRGRELDHLHFLLHARALHLPLELRGLQPLLPAVIAAGSSASKGKGGRVG